MQKSKMDALDLTTNPALSYVNLIGNSSLSCLDLRNGSSELIDYFYATECPKLTCIDVDNQVYPNPTYGFMVIEFDQPSKGILKVYDPAGRLIQSLQVNESDRLNYELEGMPDIYLMEFMSETGAVFVGKVLKVD